MPNIFATADARSSAVADRINGERLRLIPWNAGGEYVLAGAPDTTRPQAEFIGILSGALGSQNSGGDRRGGDFPSSVSTRDRQISVDKRNWPAHAREGDRIQALDQQGEPMFEMVEEPRSDGGARIITPLVRANT